jgi:hypothetical protein
MLLRRALVVGWSALCALTACSNEAPAGHSDDVADGGSSDAAMRESGSPDDAGASGSTREASADGGCPEETTMCNGACLGVGESAGNCTAVLTHLAEGHRFVLSATHIYFEKTDFSGASPMSSIWRAPLQGGNSEKVVDSLVVPVSYALNATHLFVLTASGDKTAEGGYGGAVLRAPISGGATEHLAMAGHEPAALAIDAQNVYWVTASPGSVYATPQAGPVLFRLPLAGGTPIALANGIDPSGIALDATDVYWIDQGVIRSTSLSGTAGVPADAGTEAGGAKVVFSAPDHANVVFALDGDNVDWVGNYEGLARTKKSGGGEREQLALPQGQVVSLAVGETAIYVTTLTGAVMRYDKASQAVTKLAQFPNFSLSKIAVGVDGVYALVAPPNNGSLGNAIVRFPK